jgi:hypothetical protein
VALDTSHPLRQLAKKPLLSCPHQRRPITALGWLSSDLREIDNTERIRGVQRISGMQPVTSAELPLLPDCRRAPRRRMALWQVVLCVLGCQEIPDCEQGGEEQSSSTSLSWAAAKGCREIRTVVDWIEGWIFGWDQS